MEQSDLDKQELPRVPVPAPIAPEVPLEKSKRPPPRPPKGGWGELGKKIQRDINRKRYTPPDYKQ